MNREETKAAIAVMQHYADGGEVEYRHVKSEGEWSERDSIAEQEILWDWYNYGYRIKRMSGKASVYLNSAGRLYSTAPDNACGTIKISWEEIPSEDTDHG